MKFLLVILFLAVVVNFNNVVAEKKVLYTTSSGDYTDWYPASPTKEFKFQIRARAFTINLATYPINEFPKIEIGISHPSASNTGVIWRDNEDVKSIEILQKYNANPNKFIGYWITWHNNIIKIGLEGELTEFLSWNDPKPYNINYIGVHTIASKNPGIWIIEQGFTFLPFQITLN